MNDQNDETEPVRRCRRVGCGREVPASLGTRPREYCSRNCRQRAYEDRRIFEKVREAEAAALARAATSRDDGSSARTTSRDDWRAGGNVT